MLKLTEEMLVTVCGGSEEIIVNGLGGGGESIHKGDHVTWNGHKDWGEGIVMFVVWGYALVSFMLEGEPAEHLIKTKDLTHID